MNTTPNGYRECVVTAIKRSDDKVIIKTEETASGTHTFDFICSKEYAQHEGILSLVVGNIVLFKYKNPMDDKKTKFESDFEDIVFTHYVIAKQ